MLNLRILRLRYLSIFLLLLIGMVNAVATNLEVGETYTCTLSSPPSYLKGCQWTISDTRAMEFVSTPGTYSTSVTVRAIAPQSTTTPVLVHCTYYYKELDPTTGRYIYERTGYQDWNFFIKDNGPQRIDVYPSSLNLNMGSSSYGLTATAYPSSASSSVTWSVTSGYGVVSVNSSGYVTPKSPGDAVVTATSTVNGVTGSCRVHVNSVAPTGISITPSARQSLAINSTLSFSYTLQPSYATSSVVWSMTGDAAAASLSSSGMLTGKGEGTVCVTATTDNGYSASCYVDVYKPVPTSISINEGNSIKLLTGDSRTLTYSVTPSNAIYTVTWESDAKDVVEVTQSGRITARQEGVAYIKVITDNGKSATCKVTVPPVPTAISVTPKTAEQIIGRKVQLYYSLSPNSAEARSVTWRSLNGNIASVTQDGLVTALRPGMATITATTDNGCSDSFTLTVPEPVYQLFVWMKSGEKTGYRFEQKPEFSLEGETVHFVSRQVSFDIQKEDLDKFTLEQVLPEHPTDISMSDHQMVGLGRRARLTYSLTPVGAQTQVTWLNSNPEVVSIDNSGWLQGLQVGTATVKAQTSNGLRAVCQVTVPEPRYRFYVWLRDGHVEGYAIEDKPEVTMGEELFTLTSASTTVAYGAGNVLKFTLNDAAVDDPATGIAPIQAAEAGAEFHDGEFAIYNGRPGAPVTVFDLQGHFISSYRIPEGGLLSIPLRAWPAGAYIIKTENSSYKIIKQ